jgi:catechol 1,2-dioxygenase
MDDGRAEVIVRDVLDSLREIIRRHGVTYPEYRQAVAFLVSAAESGGLPLLSDVLLETSVEAAGTTGHRAPGATDSNVEGPFFAAGAPELGGPRPDGRPVPLPMRPDEPGDALVFCGTVRSADGDAVPGAVLDLWQADADGNYSRFAPGLPEWNLRGRVTTGADGGFAVRTVVPAPYDIPNEPHTARVLELLGIEPHRPAHLHVRLGVGG